LSNDDLDFDEDVEDDETEREAIELIQKQMKEIQDLKSAIATKDTQIVTLQFEAQQADSYRTQIGNLKTQITIFEERF